MGHNMIDREYRPEEVEERWAKEWTDQGLFTAEPSSGREPFCMVIPPPNVTGDLHIGHVLVYTIHDIVARWRRMQGRDVLWLPGTDHAGIATQMVVERELAKQNLTRHQLGRVGFEKRVWEWKEEYGGRITDALRRLGSSVDWSRERFTLDEGLSRAVRAVFVRLYNDGLIYRDRYIVNWDPVFHSAISDLETEYREVKGALYTVRYPAFEGSSTEIVVATTRPETMLGDTAVAVHPDDERYRGSIGQRVVVPLTGRDVPIIADEFVDPEFGTGAVKITPAHDPNDFEAGRRHGLQELVVIGEDGRMTPAAGTYSGLDRFEARERVIDDLKREGLLLDVKDHHHAVGHSQRSGAMIEPLLSTQWFVRVKPLAEPAIKAIEDTSTRFVPENWSKTYFEWMHNIHDWCISRQLWWGHRIPAWYCDACEKMVVAEDTPLACESCAAELRQEEDVLDTWFSSALWPFTTLGWPERTEDLERYYPTSLLITGHDIIFFWVARMMMMGLKFMDDVPFKDVYIHGLVRDEQGQKMSKSKGNTIDPLEVQERYGTDAVRFTMAILAAPGNDIPLARDRMEGYRAFANKLWNATRFVLMKVGDAPASEWREVELSLADRWILSRAEATLLQVNAALEQYRFDRAADALYHFVWHQFCDWYIEFVKPEFQSGAADTAAAVLTEVLSRLLRMLHPFMPFITEELWQTLPGAESYIAVAEWPLPREAWIDEKAERDVQWLQELVVRIRNLRSASNIDAAKRIRVLLHCDDPQQAELVRAEVTMLLPLVRAEEIQVVQAFPEGLIAARGVSGTTQIAVPLEGLLDLDAERARLGKELGKLSEDLERRTKRLGDPSFVDRAPADVVEKARQIQAQLLERTQRLQAQISMLSGEG
jgi:valyl-tRNA synthetase